jgi:cellulose biosynthesis protein BcsQ
VTGEPFVLAIGSHKGGTGRTTTACALAWLWGQGGFRVTLADADPVRAAGLIALNQTGRCPWPNVIYHDGLPEPGDSSNIVIVDCPSLMDPWVHAVLRRCHGIVLTCLADPLTLRTVPAAAGALATSRVQNPRLELLGLFIGLYDAESVVQQPMLDRVRQMHGELLIEPPAPFDPAIRDWALTPGAGLPAGSAADAFAAAREQIADLALKLFRIEIGSSQLAGRA